MSPRYKPNGRLGPNILVEGGEDAIRLGFRAIKIGMNSEVVSPSWRYYSLPAETIASVTTTVDLARLDVYKRLFRLPFQTYFIEADAIGEGTWESLRSRAEPGLRNPVDKPLSVAAKDQIYRQMYDLARYLLQTYRGSGKIFILQNHEADWHTIPTNDGNLDPSDIALANTVEYLRLRQQAVNDARREVGDSGVYVYHLAEVCLVLKSMAGRRSVTNNVLPQVNCDLVGYSAWEMASRPAGEFLQAVAFLKTKVRGSFAFGNDNVVLTEIGVHERTGEDVGSVLKMMLEAITLGMPWVVHWALYDNECFRVEEGEKVIADNAREEECNGEGVRKPDGSLSRIFTAYRRYLVVGNGEPEAADSSTYVDQIYRMLLGRRPDLVGGPAAIQLIEARPWEKETVFKDLVLSPEYKEQTANSSAAFVFDAYWTLLGRIPEPTVVAFLERDFRPDTDRSAYIDAVLGSEESQRRYVDWLFRRYFNRPPSPDENRFWLGELRRGQTRRQVLEQFAAGMPPRQ